jgi:NADPH:quinone reductase-like Zn-dependent oxidoreductase
MSGFGRDGFFQEYAVSNCTYMSPVSHILTQQFLNPGCQSHSYPPTILTSIPKTGRNAIVLPDPLDIYTAAPLFCAGVTAWNGVTKAGLKKGDWVAIIGAGGLGHLGRAHLFTTYAKTNTIKAFNMLSL